MAARRCLFGGGRLGVWVWRCGVGGVMGPASVYGCVGVGGVWDGGWMGVGCLAGQPVWGAFGVVGVGMCDGRG